MTFNYGAADGEAQSQTAGFGRMERVKDLSLAQWIEADP